MKKSLVKQKLDNNRMWEWKNGRYKFWYVKTAIVSNRARASRTARYGKRHGIIVIPATSNAQQKGIGSLSYNLLWIVKERATIQKRYFQVKRGKTNAIY